MIVFTKCAFVMFIAVYINTQVFYFVQFYLSSWFKHFALPNPMDVSTKLYLIIENVKTTSMYNESTEVLRRK